MDLERESCDFGVQATLKRRVPPSVTPIADHSSTVADTHKGISLKVASRKRRTLNPSKSRFLYWWDTSLIVTTLSTAIVTPVEIGFLDFVRPRIRGRITVTHILLTIFNQGVSGVFLADVIVQFFVEYERHGRHGDNWEWDQGKIVANYLKSNFLLDFVSALPYKTLSYLGNRHFHVLSVLHILRLIRFRRLLNKVTGSKTFTSLRARVNWSYASLNMTYYVCLILLICHWMACLFGFIGNRLGRRKSWMQRFQSDWDDLQAIVEPADLNLMDSPEISAQKFTLETSQKRIYNIESPGVQYLLSLYFSIMTMTTVGYGDITPLTVEEYAIVCFCMFIGGFIWAFVIGSVCGTVSTLDVKRIEFQQKFDQFNTMLSDQRISKDLAASIRGYLLKTVNKQKRKSYRYLLSELSPTLQSLLCEEISAHYLNGVPYLRQRSLEFRLSVAKRMECAVFAPGEQLPVAPVLYHIANRGMIAHHGRIYIRGQTFQHDFILDSWEAYVVDAPCALSYAEVDFLTRDDLHHIASSFPSEKIEIQRAKVRYALIRLARTQSGNASRPRFLPSMPSAPAQGQASIRRMLSASRQISGGKCTPHDALASFTHLLPQQKIQSQKDLCQQRYQIDDGSRKSENPSSSDASSSPLSSDGTSVTLASLCIAIRELHQDVRELKRELPKAPQIGEVNRRIADTENIRLDEKRHTIKPLD